MDRAEATGLGIAAAGHLALLAALSLGVANVAVPPIVAPPIEVSFVADVAPESASPTPAAEAPAPLLAPEEGPAEPAPAAEAPAPASEPAPAPAAPAPAAPAAPPRAEPRPAPPRQVDYSERRRPERPTSRVPKIDPTPPPRAAPAPAPARPKAAAANPAPKAATPAAGARQAAAAAQRPTGRLKGLLTGIGDTESESRSETPPARVASAAVQSSLRAEVLRQLRPHWKAPTGADAEQLRTELSITLAPNGAVTNVEVLRTTGQTASNRPQVQLHQEQAIRAARLASPFRLPRDYYDAWKLLSPIGFDKRLSQ